MMEKKKMLKGEVGSHLLVSGVYLLAVSLLSGRFDWGLVDLWLGGILGTFVLDFDHFWYWFVSHPEAEDSQRAKEIWENKEKGIRGVTRAMRSFYLLLQETHFTHTRLVFHSVLGQVVLLVLAIFVVTSGGSLLGTSLVLTAFLHLLKDEWADFKKDPRHLEDWLFWQIKEPGIGRFLSGYLVLMSLAFVVLTAVFLK